MTPAVAAVKRGAKLLDTYKPGWAKKINLDKFDLGDTKHCVLGQVHRDFSKGVSQLAQTAVAAAVGKLPLNVQLEGGVTLRDQMQTTADIDPFHYGFDAHENENYEALSAQWVREITRRTTRAKRGRS